MVCCRPYRVVVAPLFKYCLPAPASPGCSIATAEANYQPLFNKLASSQDYPLNGGNTTFLAQSLIELDEQTLHPSFSIFVPLLSECSRIQSLFYGRRVHGHIVRSGHHRKRFLGNLLLKLYGTCEAVRDARYIFNSIPSRNAITWTLIIDAYIHAGDHQQAIELFLQMQSEGIQPNKVTYVRILAACSNATELNFMIEIHMSIVKHGYELDAVLATALMNMYRRSGCLESARVIFDGMHGRDVIAWNTMIATYIQEGQPNDSLLLYQQLLDSSIKPNKVTFITILGTCSSSAAILMGILIHATVVDWGLDSDVIIGTSLIIMYGKCRSPEDAIAVLNKLHDPNVTLWNATITTCVENGLDKKALTLFEQMNRKYVEPNKLTFLGVLSACATLASFSDGVIVHFSAVLGEWETDALVGTAIFNMYGKCGSLEDARRVFDKLPLRDIVMWNAMLSAYVQNKHDKEAFQFYAEMCKESMAPDKFTFNTLLSVCCRPEALSQGQVVHSSVIKHGLEWKAGVGAALVSMYGKGGKVDDARSVFESLQKEAVPLWNAMLALYAQHGHSEEALDLYGKMYEAGVKPNEFTFSAIVGACTGCSAFVQGKKVHAAIIEGAYEPEVAVANALVHMYGKFGEVESAWSVFERLHEHDVIAWNTMILGYAQHGHGEEAVSVYKLMQAHRIMPNGITFVGVFSGCAHTGLIEEGLEYFSSMQKVHSVTPLLEHYACIIDLFGRVGRLKDAEEFIHKMPIQPDAVVWKVLLGSCRLHEDVDRAKEVAQHAVELDSENTSSYVLLSNILSAYGDEQVIGMELGEMWPE